MERNHFMKKSLGLFFLGLITISGYSTAASVYTFTGEIIANNFSDNTGAISDSGLAIGSTISYSFLVDTTRQGIRTTNNGTITTYDDSTTANHTIDYFYVDLISGGLGEVDGGYYNGPGYVDEYNRGLDITSSTNPSDDWVSFLGGSANNLVQIYSGGMSFVDWIIGTSPISALESTYDSTGASSVFSSLLTLESVAPVPIPPALLLFGSGLLGLLGFSYRKRTD
ncbi:MAG: hypothetical protein JAY60_04695 [Candidatus Thiodiazotropha weberae]|nr:hypothetical protein [Candidatus Thiodiazotropha weberae]